MDLAARTHRRLLVLVGVIVAATIAGVILLWPAPTDTAAVGPSDLESGVIRSVEVFAGEPDPFTGSDGEMARLTIEVTSGPDQGETVTLETQTEGYPSFDVGDEVTLSPNDGPGDPYFVTDFERLPALGWLLVVFVGAVVAVGRWHGVRSLLGLGISLLIIVRFVVPSILTGHSPFAVALVGALAVMVVTLYLSHGVNEMTTSAVVGTAVALAVTIGLGLVFIEQAELTGYSSEEANLARFAVEGLDLRGLVLAGLIIGALGVLDDVTVAQASTVFAIHDTDRTLSWRPLFARAMRVGRDHIASTVNTLFLAYAGASIALLVLFATGGARVGDIVNSEIFAEEVVKTVVGSLGLIAAVPFTTALAATIAVRRPGGAPAVPVHVHAGEHPAETVPDHELDDEDRAYRAWVRYLREGPEAGDARHDDDREGRPRG